MNLRIKILFASIIMTGLISSLRASPNFTIRQNNPPTCQVMADPAGPVNVGQTVTLTGMASDPDGVGDLSMVQWEQTAGPVVQLMEVERRQDALIVSFMVPNTPDCMVDFGFVFRVTDRGGLTAECPVTVTEINRPPVANAGPDQIVNEQAQVMLNGMGSSDPDGDPLTFRWRLVSVSDQRFPIQLLMPDTAMPIFTAPVLRINDPPCVDYTFELIVNDGCDDSPPDTVQVRVQNLLIVRDNRSRNQVSINLCTDQQTFAYEVFVPRSNERFTGRVQIRRGQGDGHQWHIFDANNPTRLSANVDVRRLVGIAVFVTGTQQISLFDGDFENNVP